MAANNDTYSKFQTGLTTNQTN